ncbi:unnamed protein product [Prorocentrum cordatum]|uniref:Uncharacterized protein n=1 Tax=Prorocentrum cordatum TaxID=2364126 RepID=A0ABN9SLB3_9DINO|nr:unnamed protein product [Polarella glacialis]
MFLLQYRWSTTYLVDVRVRPEAAAPPRRQLLVHPGQASRCYPRSSACTRHVPAPIWSGAPPALLTCVFSLQLQRRPDASRSYTQARPAEPPRRGRTRGPVAPGTSKC